MAEFDVVIIGSGPGGYQAAIRAAQLKARVAVIEKGEIGGVCLNAGCIPTKTLIASAEFMAGLSKAKEFGVEIAGAKLNFPAVAERKGKIVKKLQQGISGILKSYNITVLKGEAAFVSANEIKIYGNTETPLVSFKKCIIASGSKTSAIPGVNIDGKTVVTSTELLNLTEVPASLLVIGGGVIGTEFASLFTRLGSKVTIIEALPKILANQDNEVSEAMTAGLKKKGVEIFTASKLLGINGNTAQVETPGGKKDLTAEKILICIGRKVSYEGLGLENAGVTLENGRIKVNLKMETSAKNIYAAGDVTGKYLLAYVASAEGITAAENACGLDSEMDYKVIPGCIFTSPEIGSVGLTEQEARSKGLAFKTGKFPFAASGRANILAKTEGFAKVIVDAETDGLLGVHIIGPEAAELIHTAAMAIKMECTTAEFKRIAFNHPTLSEVVLEAVHDVHKEAIDYPKRL
ncbi:MAG: dihydrolipoyl dehydrogenase [Candidatus Firestonebacteria bacterium]